MAEIIKDHGLLAEKVLRLKAQGKRIVFTNGGFEILHVGHVRSLLDARSRGDLLIVAVNSDRSVRANKGPGRPVTSASERMEVLAALRCVDIVTVFDEPTVDGLLLLLKPDIHAKGSDYTEQTVPERETVLSYGGRIAIVGDPKDHSTIDLLRRIGEAFAHE